MHHPPSLSYNWGWDTTRCNRPNWPALLGYKQGRRQGQARRGRDRQWSTRPLRARSGSEWPDRSAPAPAPEEDDGSSAPSGGGWWLLGFGRGPRGTSSLVISRSPPKDRRPASAEWFIQPGFYFTRLRRSATPRFCLLVINGEIQSSVARNNLMKRRDFRSKVISFCNSTINLEEETTAHVHMCTTLFRKRVCANILM